MGDIRLRIIYHHFLLAVTSLLVAVYVRALSSSIDPSICDCMSMWLTELICRCIHGLLSLRAGVEFRRQLGFSRSVQLPILEEPML